MRYLTTLAFLLAPLFAQNETAILGGRILDPTGSGVPKASVRLTSQANGAVRSVVSDHEGLYRFDLLPPGDYTLHAEAPGFKAADDARVHLEGARASLLELTLAVGAVSDSIQVDAEVSPLEATSVAEGAVISQEKIKALPLNGRQFLQLALLSPGVNSGGLAVQQNSLRQGETAGLSVAGQRTDDSAYLLDGVINTDPDYNALNYVPIVDAISEFQVQVAQYSAEYGRSSGGQINVVTQQGSNQWHGLGWEFLRNRVFDSRPFNLTTSQDVPKYQRNQFGGQMGGPMLKNRLFAFFSYEGLRNRQAGANLTTVAVPSALQRAGNFSEELPKVVIYDPSSGVTSGSRTPFPGNVIPATRINPSVSAAMNAVPLPDLPSMPRMYCRKITTIIPAASIT